jgi:hypothetical protein
VSGMFLPFGRSQAFLLFAKVMIAALEKLYPMPHPAGQRATLQEKRRAASRPPCEFR